MLRKFPRAKRAVSVLLAGLLTITPAMAAGGFANQHRKNIYYAPPPGMTLTKSTPTNGLALRSKYGVNPQLLRQVVRYKSDQRAGTIVVNTGQKYLYLVMSNGLAMRYGIGVARSGFEWSGTHRVSAKREWPSWTPPKEMIARQPEIPHFMEGGPDNPLGARALYIGATLYRIHGTNQPWTIGGNVSSGCIRLTNDDIIDLYGRIKIGAKVVVL